MVPGKYASITELLIGTKTCQATYIWVGNISQRRTTASQSEMNCYSVFSWDWLTMHVANTFSEGGGAYCLNQYGHWLWRGRKILDTGHLAYATALLVYRPCWSDPEHLMVKSNLYAPSTPEGQIMVCFFLYDKLLSRYKIHVVENRKSPKCTDWCQSPGSLGYIPRCSAHRATPASPQVGG